LKSVLIRIGIPARKTARAEAKEFLNNIACEKFKRFSCLAIANGLLFCCCSHSSLKSHGDSICRTGELPKKVIFTDVKWLRMALSAGVHKIASPIGEGSQTKISPVLLFILLGKVLSSPVYQVKS
jgi:hypothetical protein